MYRFDWSLAGLLTWWIHHPPHLITQLRLRSQLRSILAEGSLTARVMGTSGRATGADGRVVGDDARVVAAKGRMAGSSGRETWAGGRVLGADGKVTGAGGGGHRS